jgi:hypothetical protein
MLIVEQKFLSVRGLKLAVAAAGWCQSLTDRKPPEWDNCTAMEREKIPICTYLRELLYMYRPNMCSSICLGMHSEMHTMQNKLRQKI